MGWCFIFISQFSDNRYLWLFSKCIVTMLTLIFCFCVLHQSFLRKYTDSWYILCPPLSRPFGSSWSFFIMVSRCSSSLYCIVNLESHLVLEYYECVVFSLNDNVYQHQAACSYSSHCLFVYLFSTNDWLFFHYSVIQSLSIWDTDFLRNSWVYKHETWQTKWTHVCI